MQYMDEQPNKKPRIYRATGTPLSIKQTNFVKHFLQSGDATKAALKAYPNAKNANSAKAIGTENLTKPIVISEIERLMAEQGLSLNEVVQTHARNIKQDNDLSVSQRAIDSYYKVTGRYQNERAPQSVQFNIFN